MSIGDASLKDFKVTETTQDIAEAQAEFAASIHLVLGNLGDLSKNGIVRLLKAVVLAPVAMPDAIMAKMGGDELELFKRLLVLLDRKQLLMEAMARDEAGA